MRLPSDRPPTHPGEMLFEEFLKPLGLTQSWPGVPAAPTRASTN